MQPTGEADGLAIYDSGSSGEAVVWIHGYTMDTTIWRDLWAALPGWRHIGVDLPAHGCSRPLRPGETLPQVGRALAAIALKLGACHLAGMSFGSMVALQTAVEAQPPFTTLVLGSPAFGGGPTDPHAATQNLKLIQLYRLKGPGPWMRETWMQWPPDIFKGASRNPELWSRMVAVVSKHRWSEMAALGMQQLVAYRQEPRHLASIRSSTLIIVGEQDMAAFKRSAALIQRSIHGSRRVYVPDCGHLSLVERPAEAAALIEAHWTSVASCVTA